MHHPFPRRRVVGGAEPVRQRVFDDELDAVEASSQAGVLVGVPIAPDRLLDVMDD